jgi:hypothetical protein
MRLLLLSLLASSGLALPAAAQTLPASKDTVATHYQLPGADCALFPAAAEITYRIGGGFPVTGRFKPTRNQVRKVEHALPDVDLAKFLRQQPASMQQYYAAYPGIIKANLSKYQRQYYGFYNVQHQPCLYLNFFYEPGVERSSQPIPYWLRAPIEMNDGGQPIG